MNNVQMKIHSQTENPKLPNGQPKRYKIIRYTWQQNNRTIKTGLSLEQAQAHCNDPETSGKDWFDGYTEEKSSIDSNRK